MRKQLTTVIVTILMCAFNARAGKYAAEFLSTGVGARALAMGGAFVAVADDASATYWNPAGMTQVTAPQLLLMHATRFSGLLQTDVVNFIYPGKKYVIGVNYMRSGIDNIPYTSKRGVNGRPIIDKYVSDYEEAAFLSFSAAISERWSMGANLKALRQAVGDNSSLGFGFDVGMLYRVNANWSAAATLQDITGTFVYWDTGHKDTKAPAASWGLSYKKSFSFLRSALCLSVQQSIRFEGKTPGSRMNIGDLANSDFYGGAEFSIFRALALRLGSYADSPTFGAGVKFKMLQLDYAFMSYDLGAAHRISATFQF